MLVLVEGEEKECLPKFGVLIFILAHEIKQVYSLSWKHCMTGFSPGVVSTHCCKFSSPIMYSHVIIGTCLK